MTRRPPRATRTVTLYPYTTLCRSQLNAQDFVLGHAADQVDPLDAVADQEQGVADDRAAQCDLQHDQRGGGLVPEQGGEDGAQFHDGVLGSRRSALGRDAFRSGSRSEEHTSELQSLMRISYAVFCLKTKNTH